MNKELQTTESDYDIDAFLAKRTEFIKKVNGIMVEKQDFHVIQGKKSLGKGGAEKIASIFGWQAEFVADQDTLKMFGNVTGLVAFVCNLTKNKEFVGQGRGTASVGKNQNDPNKTVKMSQKSAFVDAVLRSSGLSDFFTQDIEDMDIGHVGQTIDSGAAVGHTAPKTAPTATKPSYQYQSAPGEATKHPSPPVASNDIPSGMSNAEANLVFPLSKKISNSKSLEELEAIGKEIASSKNLMPAEKSMLRGKYKARKDILTPVDTTPDYLAAGFMPEEK